MNVLDELNFDAQGLLPAVVQDARTGEVLVLAYMNRAAIEKTLETGKVTFWSRSRQKFWVKGETSGNFLLFRELRVNCELNSLLVKAEPIGPTCHEGYATCFFRRIADGGARYEIVAEQVKTPEEIYGPGREPHRPPQPPNSGGSE